MDRETRQRQAEAFHALHRKGDPLILFNAWDVASAKAIAAHFPAIATSSWAVAATLGHEDGQRVPFEAVVALTTAIAAVVTVPLSVDLEAGYGDTPEAVAEAAAAVLRAGAIGINLEDSIAGGQRGLIEPARHAAKIAAIRRMAEAEGLRFFINARTDPFLLRIGSPEECLEEAMRRGRAYAEAGADGLFVPGLVDVPLIRSLTGRVQLPVNVMATPKAPGIAELAGTGVARVSLGAWPMTAAMRVVGEAAARLAATREYGGFLKPGG